MSEGNKRKQTLLDAGEVTADPNELSGTEAQRLHVHLGRGAGREQGADASQKYVEGHVSSDNEPGAKHSTTTLEP
jgi:hypothetical protein